MVLSRRPMRVIKAWLKEHTQRELAEACGVHEGTVSRWIRKRNVPDKHAAVLLRMVGWEMVAGPAEAAEPAVPDTHGLIKNTGELRMQLLERMMSRRLHVDELARCLRKQLCDALPNAG